MDNIELHKTATAWQLLNYIKPEQLTGLRALALNDLEQAADDPVQREKSLRVINAINAILKSKYNID